MDRNFHTDCLKRSTVMMTGLIGFIAYSLIYKLPLEIKDIGYEEGYEEGYKRGFKHCKAGKSHIYED